MDTIEILNNTVSDIVDIIKEQSELQAIRQGLSEIIHTRIEVDMAQYATEKEFAEVRLLDAENTYRQQREELGKLIRAQLVAEEQNEIFQDAAQLQLLKASIAEYSVRREVLEQLRDEVCIPEEEVHKLTELRYEGIGTGKKIHELNQKLIEHLEILQSIISTLQSNIDLYLSGRYDHFMDEQFQQIKEYYPEGIND